MMLRFTNVDHNPTGLPPIYGYFTHPILPLRETLSHFLPKNRSLWRDINVDISKNYKEHVELTWWCFSSCSSSVKLAKQFLGNISTFLMIEAKHGKAISMYSNFPEENKVILTFGTHICVVSDALDHASLNVIHMREVIHDNDQDLASSFTKMNNNDTISGNEQSTFKVETYSNGHKYEGEWKNETKHGKGTYYYANGDKCARDWVDGMQTGECVFMWPDGNR
ncbi:unnamed protein product [Rotaria socialis]|uniref:Uncharacterized protein n=2 Tax=Rotaria socialis TaxID=392032 RepID=A0A820V8Q5_9BILA|nr:unnamed protein product [Rotaria socialis]CAF4496329.1 unnamed protein product [Rotaria socialis]